MAQLLRCISLKIRAGGDRVALRCYGFLPSPSLPPSLPRQPTNPPLRQRRGGVRKTNMKERYKLLTVLAYQTELSALLSNECFAIEPFGLVTATVKKDTYSTQQKTFALIIDGGPRPISTNILNYCLLHLRLPPIPLPLPPDDTTYSSLTLTSPALPPLSFTASLSR